MASGWRSLLTGSNAVAEQAGLSLGERLLVDLAADRPLERRQCLGQLGFDLRDLDLHLEHLPLSRKHRRDIDVVGP